jgi:type II secretory pathway component PulC
MAPSAGELTIIITSEEAKALEKVIAEFGSKASASENKALKTLQAKLKAAEEKML